MLKTCKWIWQHPIASKQRLASFGRYMKWQVRSRVQKGPILVPWVAGTVFAASRRQHGITGNIYAGLHEPGPMAFTLHYLRRGELFVDVGANAGSFTLLALSRGARVVAVEPIPENRAALCANIAANGASGQVDVEDCAVSNTSGVLRMMSSDCTSRFDPNGELEVAVRTLDEILGDAAPTFIKIDVEGVEQNVLEGGTRALSGCEALVVEVWGEAAATLGELGYSPYDYNPFERALVPAQRGKTHVWIRDADEVGRRLKAAPLVEVFGIKI